jgi:hypothetical protein
LGSNRTRISQEIPHLTPISAGGHVLGFASDSVYVATGSHALRVEFVEAQDVSPQADGASEAQQGKAAALSHVSYVGLWEGITLSYDAVAGGIAESTYVLDPGADPSQMRLQYNVPVEIDSAGELVLSFETGQMKESAPVAWQDIDGRRVRVDVAFQQTNTQQVGFALGKYDPAYKLTIDPTLTWNTFLGGNGEDDALAIAVDGSGNVYVGGYSDATWGSPVRAYTSGLDAFAAKLDSDGSLTWNTFLGGSGSDYGSAIAVGGEPPPAFRVRPGLRVQFEPASRQRRVPRFLAASSLSSWLAVWMCTAVRVDRFLLGSRHLGPQTVEVYCGMSTFSSQPCLLGHPQNPAGPAA